jgi:hypothetical protein
MIEGIIKSAYTAGFLVFSPWYRGTEILKNLIYIDSRKIYLKLLLIS